MKKCFYLLLALLAMAACTGKRQFSVTIESESLGTQRLTVVYTTADGNRVALEPIAVDGKVEFTGEASKPSHVEIFSSTGMLMAEFMAQNGEKINITFDADGTPSITGNAIAEIPSESSSEPDSLFTAPEVIVGHDSVETWPAEGVWVFTSAQTPRVAQVMDSIKAHRKVVRDVYVGVEYDEWRMAVRHDSATWRQGLLPDAPVAIKQLTALPLMMEVDSAGKIVRVIKL